MFRHGKAVPGEGVQSKHHAARARVYPWKRKAQHYRGNYPGMPPLLTSLYLFILFYAPIYLLSLSAQWHRQQTLYWFPVTARSVKLLLPSLPCPLVCLHKNNKRETTKKNSVNLRYNNYTKEAKDNNKKADHGLVKHLCDIFDYLFTFVNRNVELLLWEIHGTCLLLYQRHQPSPRVCTQCVP